MTWLPEPIFIEGAAGRVFALHFPAKAAARGALVYLPPFAEEMNRCRATVAQQAYKLSELGYATLLLDPYGTGDSEGDLAEATWDIWLQDVAAATRWLEDRAYEDVGLWGLRTGALLAADFASRDPERYRRLIFWQPVTDGRLFVTQYLRLRVANLMDNGLPPETTEEMRAALASGSQIEVAGYLLSGQLVADLDGKKLTELGLAGQRIDWFELVAESGQPLGPASRMAIQKLSDNGCIVSQNPVTGPPIWQLHKRADLPEIITSTTGVMGA